MIRRSADRWRPTWAETEYNRKTAEAGCLYMMGYTVNECARRIGEGAATTYRRLQRMGFRCGPVGSYSRAVKGYRKGQEPSGAQAGDHQLTTAD